METGSPGPGLLGSLRGFADGVLGSVHDRIELLAVELHEEKHRLVQILILICSIAFLAVLALIFVSLAIVLVFWDKARVGVTIGLAVTYGLGLLATVFGFRR